MYSSVALDIELRGGRCLSYVGREGDLFGGKSSAPITDADALSGPGGGNVGPKPPGGAPPIPPGAKADTTPPGTQHGPPVPKQYGPPVPKEKSSPDKPGHMDRTVGNDHRTGKSHAKHWKDEKKKQDKIDHAQKKLERERKRDGKPPDDGDDPAPPSQTPPPPTKPIPD